MPNGRANLTEEEWIMIEKNRYRTWYDGGGVILFNSYNQVLLVQDKFSKRWSFPKGRVEKEDCDFPIVTSIRETKEETGLEYGVDYVMTSFDPVMIHYDTQLFKAILLVNANDAHTDGINESTTRWCSKEYIKNKIWKYTNSQIKNFVSKYW
jgi:8-oxo-dGTP pyrophosphatase MutT (NUDIX family)